MKIVIIGGGIAGLSLGLLLRKTSHEVVVCERSVGLESKGHAFLMSADGFSILSPLMKEAGRDLEKQQIELFNLKRPDGEEVIKIQLDGWYCMKRVDLVKFLYSFYDHQHLKEGRVFSHFVYEGKTAVAAVFKNGDVEYGDLFIGADGSNSRVREEIFGKTEFTPVEVKEIVGVAKRPANFDHQQLTFRKIQSKKEGLAFGYIPASGNELVWFMQYDTRLAQEYDHLSTECLRSFCNKMMRDFPEEVRTVLNENDFSSTYIWNTRDFNVPDTFHKENIVLMGDAAHLALPFTSAGTTNALLDAQILATELNDCEDLELAFQSYYQQRAPKVKAHLEQGRELKKLFLDPIQNSERGFILPLVSDKDRIKKQPSRKPLKVLYFTDPVCSTCWVIQPLMRKLTLEYDAYLDIEYRMGGLLPSWANYNGRVIKTPADAAKHWEEVSASHEIPIDGDIWLEDPLHSSFPPSIAFKAAQLQDNDKAISFLRRLREMVFVEKMNITKWKMIERAALTSGLDSALLLKQIQGKGLELFLDDLKLAEQLSINIFPTLLFDNGKSETYSLQGFQPYSKFEETIHRLLPGVSKSNQSYHSEELFALFNNMTENEFIFLSNRDIQESRKILEIMYRENKIRKVENKNGFVWVANTGNQNRGQYI